MTQAISCQLYLHDCCTCNAYTKCTLKHCPLQNKSSQSSDIYG